MTVQTLEQRRARDAWEKSGAGVGRHGKEYVNLSKSLPALIMNSGLMQVMAFLHTKGEQEAHGRVAADLREWLHVQCGTPVGFVEFMESMMDAEPSHYQAVTMETFAWLKWLRHIAAARQRTI